ncbi:MAG: bifunctional 4-hydroxy-2-oxoglutarate aldolase/2-dehydro-3-deoxy-phosphogluconate aldolase [Sphingobacteriales bacterium]|nr:bifunctional 4-hydroxy-2-oxoglutarate aldolase/2-dehydro-3-deoxy-phosphogluconate aldolase [Sphingobacteriales bacterium]
MISEVMAAGRIKEQRILPLFYNDNEAVCKSITSALYLGGIRVIEFTNRGTEALPVFKTLIELRNHSMPDLLIGAGTIKTSDEANAFINAGADFLISPVFDNGVSDAAYINKVLWIPGCMTPAEIHLAEKAGYKLVKLFPGNLLKPDFVSAIKPLFGGIDFLVTGGVDVTEESLRSWYNAGVVSVGLGSKFITNAIVHSGNFAQLTKNANEVLKIVKNNSLPL